MSSRHSRAVALSAVLLAGATAACGSTVPLTQSLDGQSGASGLQSGQAPNGTAEGPSNGDATAGSTSADGSTTGSASVGGQAGGKATPGLATPTGPGQSAPRNTAGVATSQGAVLPGITPTSINIGIHYVDTAAVNAAVSSTGAEGSAAGDIRAQYRAVASYLNAHGGLAGRKIRLVEHEVDISSDTSTAAQAICENWTTDNKVAAGLGATAQGEFEILVSCLAKRNTLAIGTNYNVGARSAFRRYRPYYYAPAALEMVTAGRAYIEGLAAQRYFSPDVKVGILVYDSPEFREAMRDGVLPALRRQGVTPTETIWITPPSALSDQGKLVSDIQAATLKMKAQGVTHVLFLDGNASISYFFMKQAESQNYTPRYGLSTLSYPSFLQANFDADQLGDALTVGWMPTQDVDMPHLPPNQARALCQKIMKDASLEATVQTDLTIQLSICSNFFLLKAGLDAATELSADAFAQAIASLGTTNVTAASGLLDSYAEDKAWGAAQYHVGAYSTSCSCFSYRGPARNL